MGSSLNNANEDYGDVHETYTPPFDVVCPQLPGKKPNLHQSSCDIRLSARKIPKCCRTCKGIVDKPKPKNRHEGGMIVDNPSTTPCACGNDRESGYVLCPECKVKNEIKRKKYRKEWYARKRKQQREMK